MDLKSFVELKLQNEDLHLIYQLLIETIARQQGLTEYQVSEQLVSLRRLGRNQALADAPAGEVPPEVVARQFLTNSDRIQDLLELMLLILSHQTGRSILDLRNAYLSDSDPS